MQNKTTKALVIITLILTLFNCASSPIKTLDPLIVSQTHGYVVASLIVPTSRLPAIEYVGVGLETEDGKFEKLTASGNFRQTKQVLGWIPEGTYRLASYYKGNQSFSESIGVSEESVFDIHVKAGEVLDLNHLIPIDLGQSKGVLLSIPRTQKFTADVLKQYPELYPKSAVKSWVDENSILEGKTSSGATYSAGLIPDLITAYGERLLRANKVDLFDGSTSHSEAFNIVKNYGIPSTEVKTDTKANSYFGTQTGQIRYQNGSDWRFIDTGYVEAVVALDIADDGSIVVGLESGKLIKTEDRGKSWVELYALNKGELIFETVSVDGKRFVGAWIPSKTGSTEIIRFGQMIDPELVLYEEIDRKLVEVFRVQAGRLGAFFQGVPHLDVMNEKIYVSLMLKTLHEYDVKTKVSRVITTPKNFSGISFNKNKGFITTWYPAGMFSNAFYSDDYGESWKKLPKPPYQPRYIHFNGPEDSYMWSVSIGMISTPFQLDKMNSKSKRWDKVTKSETKCRQLLRNFIKNEHYCVFSTGVIQTFNGTEWLK